MKGLKALALATTAAVIGVAQSAHAVTTVTETATMAAAPAGFLVSAPEGFGAKYRINNTNWDMSLGNKTNTGTSADYLGLGLGDTSGLSGIAFDFKLTYTANSSYVFEMKNVSTGVVYKESWGIAGTDTLNEKYSAVLNGISPGVGYNAIEIEVRAQKNPAQMSISNLAFTIAASLGGSPLMSGNVGRDGSGNMTGTIASAPSDRAFQYLVADGNLASVNWMLSGTIIATTTYTGCSECLRVGVSGKNVVPIPAALPLLGTAVAGLGLAAWRKRRAA